MTSVSRDRAPLLFAIALLGSIFLALPALPALAADGPGTNDEKAFYSIGSSQGQQLKTLAPISDREFEMIVQGMRDALAGTDPAVDAQEGAGLVRELVTARQAAASAVEKQAGIEFAAAQAKRKGATKTESGLVYIETKAGNGASPSATDKVRVHYHGTLRDGTVFDSSVDRGTPAEFPLNRVIACWTEGVAKMKEGGKSTLICPPSIAYGDRATGRIPAGATLSFDVELIEIVE